MERQVLDKLRLAAATGLDMSPGDPVAEWAVARITELEAALRPFGDAYRYTQQMGSMRREYEASMTCTGKFTVQDLARAAALTKSNG